jgi:nitrogen regulatory protein P-II 2
MHTVPLSIVTIVAEPVLEDRLVHDLRRLGVTGHTITDARGEGSRGVRASDPPGVAIRLEVAASAEVADRVLTHLATEYFPHYAVIAWLSEARVVRGEKYR